MKTHQSGSVLAISLVLLTAITLIAIMGLQRAGLQTKISGAIQHYEAAFNCNLSELDWIFQDTQRGNTQALSDAMNSEKNTSTTSSNIQRNPFCNVVTNITHNEPTLGPGMATTSSLRNNNSRGKNGGGVQKFEITSTTSLPNRISSSQKIGTTFFEPE